VKPTGPLASGWGLSDAAFTAWWGAISPADRDEFSHAYGGSLTQARFVCALDGLTNIVGLTDDLTMRAYCLAANLEYDALHRDFQTRTRAQAMAQSAPVERLGDLLRYRSQREAEARIAARTARKIEDLYDRADATDDEQDKLQIEQIALNQSNMYLTRASKERAAHENRRQQEAIRDAVLAGKNRENEALRAPSDENMESYIAQIAEHIGPEKLLAMVQRAAAGIQAQLPP
jgi:hypothetical protein